MFGYIRYDHCCLEIKGLDTEYSIHLKMRFCEKAAKFCKITTLDLTFTKVVTK